MDQQQRSRWRRIVQQVSWIVVVVVAVSAAVFVINYFFVHRSLWDWIKLLIVPAVVAGGGIWFNRQQRERELEIAREQRERDVEIAERRTQDEALQAYLQQMSDMLIPSKDQPSLYKARPGDSLSSVARARTLTVLPRLDGDRKARVVQFLHESGLISKNHPILELDGADLDGAYLVATDLEGADLSGASLNEAHLSVSLSGAILRRPLMSKAYLGGGHMIGTNLNQAILSEADLSGAVLLNADLSEAILIWADLSEAKLDGADLSGAYLSGATLSEASLTGSILRGTLMSRADLSDANLQDADLSYADLSGAKGVTNEELDQQARDLEGATMPNGQKYEDWLKSKGSGEDGETE